MGETVTPKAVKETVLIVGVLALATAGIVGTYWMETREDGAAAAEAKASRVVAPAPAAPEALHDDVYFDFKSVRLRADAARLLQQKAGMLKAGGQWVVLVAGYADGQGPAEYNRVLAQKRAEAVKQFLVEEGVPETSIKAVTIGSDGALCQEPTKECQQLNRRVHLEMRNLAPKAAAAAVGGAAEAVQAR